MQSSFQGSSTIDEEDLIDNIEPDLIDSTSSEAFSSLFASDSGLDHHDERQHTWEKDLSFDEDKTNSSINGPSQPSAESAVEKAPHPTRSSTPKSKLSLSMHDISGISAYPLTDKASHASSSTIQSRSITTDASVPKSKDSGFPRSVSCYSLSSSKRYDHVESKVKKYISQIKLENRSSRSKNMSRSSIQKNAIEENFSPTNNEALSVGMLVPVIDKLKEQLEDKDKMLLKLQENYDNLLMEYAAAKNRIDYLRISSASASIGASSHMPFSFDVSSYKKPKASESILLQSELDKLLNESTCDFETSYESKIQLRLPKQDQQKSFARSLQPYTSVNNEKDLQCAISDGSAIHDISRDEDKELSPERLNRQIADNPFVKVKRWQDSLPPFGLIEPSSYDSLPSTSNSTHPGKSDSASSKLSNLYSTKDDTGSNNTSNLILYSRSISQPNCILSRDDLCLSMDMNQANSLLSLSSAQFSSGSLKYEAESTSHGFDFDIKINKTLPNSLNASSSNAAAKHNNRLYHQRYLRVPEISNLCRKKIVKWKANNILLDHMKGLTSPKVTTLNRSLPLAEVKCASLDYDVEELNLVHCLDEVNQCAKNLNGESEAIMQALAKQLKASDSNSHLAS